MEDRIKAHVIIQGRVQGVFYRAWTEKEAKKLSLTGHVRNLADGRVEALFEGRRSDVEKMLLRCKAGPKFSKPADIKVKIKKEKSEFGDFIIKH